MLTATLLLAIGVLVLASFVQGLTGFGFGMIAMGILPSVLGLDQAQAVVTVTGMAMFAAMTGLTLRDAEWSGAADLYLGSALGVPLGFGMLSALPQVFLVRLLGLAICLLVLFEIGAGRGWAPARRLRPPRWAGLGLGVASGALSGAFNIGGPPIVAYVYGRPWTKERQVATLSVVFLSTGLIRLLLVLHSDRPQAATWASAAWAIGPMIAAIVCGHRLLRYVPQRRLRAGVFAALLAIGGRYLVFGP